MGRNCSRCRAKIARGQGTRESWEWSKTERVVRAARPLTPGKATSVKTRKLFTAYGILHFGSIFRGKRQTHRAGLARPRTSRGWLPSFPGRRAPADGLRSLGLRTLLPPPSAGGPRVTGSSRPRPLSQARRTLGGEANRTSGPRLSRCTPGPSAACASSRRTAHLRRPGRQAAPPPHS